MARRVLITDFRLPEGVETIDEAAPEPGDGEVRIRVRAAGVNPYEVRQVTTPGDPARLPLRLGSEATGTIDALGDGVDALAVGDEVVAYPVRLAWGEFAIAKAPNVFARPAELSVEQAAALLLVGVTAWHMVEAAGVADGDTVIVQGAGSGVGAVAVQLARRLGARVIGTVSPASSGYVAGLGAEPVLYGDGLEGRLRALLPDGADAVIDAAGTDEALDSSVALVADRGRILSAAGFSRGTELGIHLVGSGGGADPGREIRAAAKPRLIELAAAGELTVRIGAVLPLERAAEALALVASGHPGGKVLLSA